MKIKIINQYRMRLQFHSYFLLLINTFIEIRSKIKILKRLFKGKTFFGEEFYNFNEGV